MAFVALALSGCAGKSQEPESPELAHGARSAPASEGPAAAIEHLPELDALKERLERAEDELSAVRAALAERTKELTALEEVNAGLELELASALEELLRSQASVRSVQSRAFAISRISEVRVEIEEFRGSRDPALRARLERAAEFLDRADRVLAEGNVGGAAYLADRAGELLRQTRIVAEARRHSPSEILPIVPPRKMEVQTRANLRRGPTTESERVGGVSPGTPVKAVARQGEWFQIVLRDGTKAWIHRGLVR